MFAALLTMAPKVTQVTSGWDVHINPTWIMPGIIGFILGAIVFGKATR